MLGRRGIRGIGLAATLMAASVVSLSNAAAGDEVQVVNFDEIYQHNCLVDIVANFRTNSTGTTRATRT